MATTRSTISQSSLRTACDLAAAAHRSALGEVFGVGRVGGWSTALAGLLIATLTSGALAGPDGARVVKGDVSITRNGAETLIRAGRNSIINYRSFDIAAGETVRFVQPDASSRVLNRVYSAQPTRIDGSLIANGRVYVVNPAGVVFSGTARVDVNGLYAAAGKLSDADFLRGVDRFTDLSGRVVNEGLITADFVGLLGRSVGNAGTIIAPAGTVVMASGQDVLVGKRDEGVYVRVKGAADGSASPAVENSGTIDARGGSVALAAGDVYSMAMRVGGGIRARKVTAQAASGEVIADGTIDASARAGDASGTAGGGAAESGTGGRVEILGDKVGLVGARIDASGTSGGGDVRIGGDVRGEGSLPHASVTYVSADSSISVDAIAKGKGGTAVVWSDQVTRVFGDITARGGAQGGDGGFIETSSKGAVDLSSRVIDAGAAKGKGGSWLIDPRNVIISAVGSDDGSVVGGIFSPNADNANVNRGTIETALNADTNITITTADAAGSQSGTIAVNATITKSAGTGSATLTLRAADDITVSSAISATSGTLNVSLQANADPNDLDVNAGSVRVNAAIGTNGGTFSSSGVGFTNSASITATGGVTLNHTGAIAIGAGGLASGGGNVTISTLAPLAIGGVVNTGGGDLVLNTGGVTQTARIQVGALTLVGTGDMRLAESTNSIDRVTASVIGAVQIVSSGGITVGGAGITTANNDISILAPAGLVAQGVIDAGSATVTLGTNAIDLQADVTGNGGLYLFPFSDGVSIGLAGAAGSFNLTSAELSHLRCTGTVIVGMGSVGAGDLNADSFDLSASGLDRDYSIQLLGNNVHVADITLKSGKTLEMDSADGDLRGGTIVAPGGFTAVAVRGGTRGSFTLTGGVTTSNAAVAIDADLLVSGASVALQSGGGDVSVAGSVLGTTDDVDGLTINAGAAGRVVAGGTLAGGAAAGSVGTSSLTLHSLSVTGSTISLPTLFLGGGGGSLSGATSTRLAAIATTTLGGGAPVAASAVTSHGGTLSFSGNGTVNLPGVVVSDGSVAFSNVGLTTLGARVVTNNADVTFSHDLTANGLSIDAGTGAIRFAASSAVALGAGASTLVAGEIDLPAAADAVSGDGSTTTLTIKGGSASTGITLGNAALDADATLELSDGELASLASSITALTIGRADGTGLISVNSASFRSQLLLQATGIGGSISLDGLTQAGAGKSVTLDASAGSLRGSLTTSGGDLVIQTPFVLAADATLETSGAGVIRINAAVDAGTHSLTLTAADVDLLGGGSLAGTGSLILQPNAAASDVVIGNALDSDAGFDVTADALSGTHLVPGFASITIGRADGTGLLSFASSLTFADPVIFRMGGAGGSITVGQHLSGTGDGGFTFDAASTSIQSNISLSGGELRFLSDVTFGAVTLSTGGGLLDVDGDATLAGSLVVNAGAVTFSGIVNADATASLRDLTITSTGAVTFNDTVGSAPGTLLHGLSVSGSSISLRAVHTADAQTYSGVTRVNGDLLADAGNLSVATGSLIVVGDSTLESATGSIVLGGDVDSAAVGSERALTLTATTGSVSIGGTVGGVAKLAGFNATATSITTGSVRSIGQVEFDGPTIIRPASGEALIEGTTVTFSQALRLDVSTTVRASTAAVFASTIKSSAGLLSGLSVESPLTTFGGDIGGLSGDLAELGSLVTDDGGSVNLASSSIRVRGAVTFGDAVTLNSDVTVNAEGSIAFRSTVDSDATQARALTVNSGGITANTVFTGNVGQTHELASITTNAEGTTFLPAIIRTTGAQVYLDDVRLAANAVLTAGSFNFDRRINSDTSVHSLTLNASGETRLGGAVGGTIAGSPEAVALSSFSTDAAGTLVLAGDVTTTGDQHYGEAADLGANVTLSGNGITFSSTIRSQEGGPTRALTMNGGAGGIIVAGDIGVGSNLTSFAAAATTISVRGVQTTGSQSYAGTTTIAGSVAALGGDFDAFGTTSVVGNIQGNTIRFRRSDAAVAAPTTIGGTVTSTASGAVISFQDDLFITQDTTISGNNAAVTFGGRVNTQGATARSLTVNTSGLTTFTGVIGDASRLQNLSVDALGTTRLLGGTVATNGVVSLLDPLTLSANTTITGSTVTFGATVNGDVAGRDLTITSSGTTTFAGVVGGSQTLGRLLVNDQNTNRATILGGNVTTARGMVFGGAVTLLQDTILDGGAGTLFFRGAIDTDTNAAATRALTLRSVAPVKLATTGDATDIAGAGATTGNVTVTPFRFSGSVGAARALSAFTLGSDLSGSPRAATAVFAAPLNGAGGFDSSGRIVPQRGMFDSITRTGGVKATTSTFVIKVDGAGFTMGAGQKLTAFGNISINAAGRAVTLSDLSATGRIDVTASSISLRHVGKSTAFTNQLVGGVYKTRPEFLVDFVARDGIDFNLPGGAMLSPAGGALFATNSGLRGKGLDTQIFSAFQTETGAPAFVTQALFNAPGVTNRLLPIDLVAGGSSAAIGTVFDGPAPVETRRGGALVAFTPSGSMAAQLERLGLHIRSDAAAPGGDRLHDDSPVGERAAGADLRISGRRLDGADVEATVESFCDLAYENGAEAYAKIVAGDEIGQDRLPALRSALLESWSDYSKLVGPAGASGAGFRQHLEEVGQSANRTERLALIALDKARALFESVDALALSPRERAESRRAIVESLGGGKGGISDLEAAIVGRSLASSAR